MARTKKRVATPKRVQKFKGYRVGDSVTCLGAVGIIESIGADEYPINVTFNRGRIEYFTEDGKLDDHYPNIALIVTARAKEKPLPTIYEQIERGPFPMIIKVFGGKEFKKLRVIGNDHSMGYACAERLNTAVGGTDFGECCFFERSRSLTRNILAMSDYDRENKLTPVIV